MLLFSFHVWKEFPIDPTYTRTAESDAAYLIPETALSDSV